MNVVCTGPESCGTRLLTKVVAAMPGIEATHRSIPNGGDWNWWRHEPYDAAIVIVRDFWPASHSNVSHGHRATVEQALGDFRQAFGIIAALPYPWWMVTLASLIQRPEDVARAIAGFLGTVPGRLPVITDTNAKWYG